MPDTNFLLTNPISISTFLLEYKRPSITNACEMNSDEYIANAWRIAIIFTSLPAINKTPGTCYAAREVLQDIKYSVHLLQRSENINQNCCHFHLFLIYQRVFALLCILKAHLFTRKKKNTLLFILIEDKWKIFCVHYFFVYVDLRNSKHTIYSVAVIWLYSKIKSQFFL